MAKSRTNSVKEYLASQPKEIRPVLRRVRDTIRKALPDAEEVISYQIPAFKLRGRIALYFAGWKEHYSLYPSNARLEEAFKDELAPYEVSGKGTIRFPVSKPVPVRLIVRIARFRANEVAEREKAAKKKR